MRRKSTTHALLVFIFFLQRIIIRLRKLHLCSTILYCTEEKHVLHFMKMIILILIEKMNRKKKIERWKFVEVCLSVHLSFFSYFSIFFSQFLIYTQSGFIMLVSSTKRYYRNYYFSISENF